MKNISREVIEEVISEYIKISRRLGHKIDVCTLETLVDAREEEIIKKMFTAR